MVLHSSLWHSLAKPMESPSYYLGVYIFLSVMYIVSLTIRETIQYTSSLHASQIPHQMALDRILHSPIRFFDAPPHGCIINRFTRDMDTVDQQVTNVAANVMVDFLGTLTLTGVIAYVTPQFLVHGLVISALFVISAVFYTRTSRELKRHESTTDSPVYSHFAETLNGVTTIRAFGFEERLNSLYQEVLNEHNRPYFYTWECNRWLSVRVDVLSAFVSLFVGLLSSSDMIPSTLAVAFVRFMEMTSGNIEIDWVDISRIGRYDLQLNLTIIPRDPVLFIGIVRSNLDPFHQYDDAALWAVLKRVHLVSDNNSIADIPTDSLFSTTFINNNGFGNLDSEVKENGSNLSQG